MSLPRLFLVVVALQSAGCLGLFQKKHERDSAQARAAASVDRPKKVYQNPAFAKSAEDLAQMIKTQTEGFSQEGAVIKQRLDGFAAVPVKLKRGKCYRMVVELAEGATFSEHAKKGVRFFTSGVDTGLGSAVGVNGGPGIAGPGGVASMGCPQADAPDAAFDIIANAGSASSQDQVHDLGAGVVNLRLFSKPISAKDLAERKAELGRQLAASDEFNRREAEKAARQKDKDRAGCDKCQSKYIECLAETSNKPACSREREHCEFPFTHVGARCRPF